ncbi:MAG TPA: ABC transporter ATP-binding protein [Actinomycetota bacterium]|nr:ABC transporter ATP-binding protein [Actinomycetota bacterium]HVL64148.1 ABC transporter ATP-binding protein [Actinomycetota bacterium]
MALLRVEDLAVRFETRKATIHAVNGISFELEQGETLGIVGESGCGKSVSSLALLGILPKNGRVTSGSVRFGGRELLELSDAQMREVRGRDIAMIFQDPMTSLNPVLPIRVQITEALRKHLRMNDDQAREEAVRLLQRVGIPAARERVDDYPHQFSGGMRQRVMIAMAISCRPKVLIADEPTTALDVTIQAQILEVLRQLVAEERMALVLITHDLGVVAGLCERTHVMYAGRFIETGTTSDLFARPRHPYTLGLLKSVPRLDAARKERLEPIQGVPRDLRSLGEGCAFAPRCLYATDRSWEETPPLRDVAPGHRVACWNPVPDADLPDRGAPEGEAG